MRIRARLVAAAVLSVTVASHGAAAWAQGGGDAEFSYTFDSGPDGWTAGFADLPVDWEQATFELDHGHGPLPDGLEGSGICLQGHNRSDDLFMYLKRQVDGLGPNAVYYVAVSVDLATDVSSGLVGIGGSPGESVFVKVGASAVEPVAAEDRNEHLRMNIDKGNQSRGGSDMVVVGNVASPQVVEAEYRIKTLDSEGAPLTVQADERGALWLIVGTDSGFEGLTRLCYSRISYTLSAQGDPGAEEPPDGSEPTQPPSTTAPIRPEPTEPSSTTAPDEAGPDLTRPDETRSTVPTDGAAPADSGSAAISPAWVLVIIAAAVGAVTAWGFAARRRRAP